MPCGMLTHHGDVTPCTTYVEDKLIMMFSIARNSEVVLRQVHNTQMMHQVLTYDDECMHTVYDVRHAYAMHTVYDVRHAMIHGF